MRAVTRRLFLGLALSATAVLASCGPPYQIVRQIAPNPFVGATQFAMLPVTWDGVTVGRISEAEYLTHNPRRVGNYLEAKPLFGPALIASLTRRSPGLSISEAVAVMAGPPMMPPPVMQKQWQPGEPSPVGVAPMAPAPVIPPGFFVIHVNVENFEPGFHTLGVTRAAEAHVRVQVISPSGVVLDEFLTNAYAQTSAGGGYGSNSIATRMNNLGNSCGRSIARYLRDRMHVTPPPA